MNAVDIIRKKRDREELSQNEIAFLVAGITDGSIPDYQISAWAMAVTLNGMSHREIADLTIAMAGSGEQADLSSISGIKVDKHSTGGVGDKTTLVVAPIVAAAGISVAKMSGRGLGHTGGTIDKLESIPGLSTGLSPQDFVDQVREIGLAVISQSGGLAPADKRLYALRDVTATVDSLPLIASSIMSKKIASGADRILLDVKCGSGAFMRTQSDAVLLAETMIDIGRQTGRRVGAIISRMEHPLGRMIGNALEVRECIDILRGRGPDDLRELCLELAAAMIYLADVEPSLNICRDRCVKLLNDGSALARFMLMIERQGGRLDLDLPGYGLPEAPLKRILQSPQSGYLVGFEAGRIGRASAMLGAGRQKKEDTIEPAAGIELMQAPGVYITRGSPIAALYSSAPTLIVQAEAILLAAFKLDVNPPVEEPLVLARLLD